MFTCIHISSDLPLCFGFSGDTLQGSVGLALADIKTLACPLQIMHIFVAVGNPPLHYLHSEPTVTVSTSVAFSRKRNCQITYLTEVLTFSGCWYCLIYQ